MKDIFETDQPLSPEAEDVYFNFGSTPNQSATAMIAYQRMIDAGESHDEAIRHISKYAQPTVTIDLTLEDQLLEQPSS